MNPLSELHAKWFFGAISFLSAGLSGIGAILTQGDIKWFCITFSTSVLTCGFLSLIVKKPNDTMQSVTGRCGLSIIAGILGSKAVAHFFTSLHWLETNALMLSFVSGVVCILFYLVGFKVLKEIDRRSDKIAEEVTNHLEDKLP